MLPLLEADLYGLIGERQQRNDPTHPLPGPRRGPRKPL